MSDRTSNRRRGEHGGVAGREQLSDATVRDVVQRRFDPRISGCGAAGRLGRLSITGAAGQDERNPWIPDRPERLEQQLDLLVRLHRAEAEKRELLGRDPQLFPHHVAEAPVGIEARIGAVGHDLDLAFTKAELAASAFRRGRVVGKQHLGGAGEHPAPDAVEPTAERRMRVELVDRPCERVAECARGREP